MLGFLKKMIGLGANSGPSEEREYKGFLVIGQPIREGATYRIAGLIKKGDQEKPFVRSDTTPSGDEALAISISKGCMIVDQQGEKLFKRHTI